MFLPGSVDAVAGGTQMGDLDGQSGTGPGSGDHLETRPGGKDADQIRDPDSAGTQIRDLDWGPGFKTTRDSE